MRICAETEEACELIQCYQAFRHKCDRSCSSAFCHKKGRDIKCVRGEEAEEAEDVQTR